MVILERLRGRFREQRGGEEIFDNVTTIVHYFVEKRIRFLTTTPGVVIDRDCDFVSRELGVLPKFTVVDILFDATAGKATLGFDPPVRISYIPTACWIHEM